MADVHQPERYSRAKPIGLEETFMGHDQLRGWLRRLPFRPFRLHISGGEVYDVAGPEWMMVTPQNTAVGIPGQAGDGDIVTVIDNSHITHVEPLPSAPAPQSSP